MATAVDPICQMDVNTDNPSGGQSEYQGTTYYFCAPGCKRAFDQDPEKYLSAEDEVMPHQHHAPEPPKASFISRLFGRK
ncbi:MAG: YHS domain-containing protein [Chloroflexi bacterium]|nr:YHS domain-containing protein [Chloroflexota bacterium]MDA1218964.1 YHS domain-containing protein [Chloroflexota bacterium]